jgi:hypothetical protein
MNTPRSRLIIPKLTETEKSFKSPLELNMSWHLLDQEFQNLRFKKRKKKKLKNLKKKSNQFRLKIARLSEQRSIK